MKIFPVSAQFTKLLVSRVYYIFVTLCFSYTLNARLCACMSKYWSTLWTHLIKMFLTKSIRTRYYSDRCVLWNWTIESTMPNRNIKLYQNRHKKTLLQQFKLFHLNRYLTFDCNNTKPSQTRICVFIKQCCFSGWLILDDKPGMFGKVIKWENENVFHA